MKRKSLLFALLLTLFVPWAANAQATLLTEDFSNMTSLSTSYSASDWFTYNAGNGNNWALYDLYGNKTAGYKYNSSYPADCYLVSAPFSVSATTTQLTVCLKEKVQGDSYPETFEAFFVKASDVTSDATVASATKYGAIASASYTNTIFQQVTGSSTNSALAGQSVRVVVHCTSAADRYYLYVDDIVVSEASPVLPDMYSITAWPNNANYGSVTGAGDYAENTSCTLTALPASGYVFDHWVMNSAATVTDNPYTFTVTANADFQAVFAAIAPATIPYICDFETASENGNWQYANGSYNNKWYIGTGTNHGGSKSLYISSNNGTSNTYITGASYVYAYRDINFETAGEYTISFDWQARGESGCYDAMYAALVPSGTACPPASNITGSTNSLPTGYINVADASQSVTPSGVFLWTNDASGWKFSNKTINISATGTYTLVFYWKNDGSDGSNPPAAVDNIGIKALTCYVPTAFATTNVSTTGATLSWTAGGSETDWVIEYGTASDFSGATSVYPSNTPTTTLSGLAAGTKYYARIKSDCGGGDQSYWSNTISFTTECDAIDLSNNDFSENFDNCTAGNNKLPDCWYYINTTTYSYYAAYPQVYGYNAYSDPNCLYFYSYAYYYGGTTTYDPQPQYAILPNMQNLAGKQVSLRAKGSNANNSFKIGTMSNPTDASTFNLIAEQVLSTDLQEYVFVIPAGTTDNHVVIMIDAASSSRTSNSAYIDDITITDVPTCLKPVELAYSDVTAHTAQLSWTNGEEGQTAWQICLNDDVTHLIDATTNPFTLTGLVSETNYTVKVRANCGEGDYSDWSDPVNFTTAIACPAPTDLAVAPGSYSAEVSWSGSSESYTVQYRTARYVDGLEEQFAGNGTPTGWENKTGLLSGVMAGTTELSDNSQWNFGIKNGVFDNHAYINIYGSSRYGWLVTPSVTVKSGDDLDFDLALTNYYDDPATPTGTCSDDRFVVLITTDDMESWTILREWNNSGSAYVYNNIATAGEAISIDLSAYVGQAVKIAFYGESTTSSNGDNNLHIDNVFIGTIHEAGSWQTVNVDETTATLTGLTPETRYDVKVQGNCGDEGMSVETDIITFTTFTNCPTPTDLTVSNLTQNTADLDWTGASDVESYVVKYRTADQINGISEEFGNTSIPEDWNQYSGLLSSVMVGTTPLTTGYAWYFGSRDGVLSGNHAYINIYGTSLKNWLVTPSMTVKSGDAFTFDLALTKYNSAAAAATDGTDDRFVVLITTNDMESWTILREWNNSGSADVYNNIATAGQTVNIDLSAYVGLTVKIAFYGESTTTDADNDLHIDNVIIGTPVAAGEWTQVSDINKPYHLTGLTAGTMYEVQVMSGCATDEWSEMFSFRTFYEGKKVFVTEGNWGNQNNWIPTGAPEITDEVIIRANAQIENGTVAAAKKITFEGKTTPTLTILDGGQLQTNNSVYATVKKNIAGYSENSNYDAETYNNANYYLIGTPTSYSLYSSDITASGLLTGTYDLFSWDYAASNDLEWKNYKANTFNISRGSGYLYANQDNTTLSFTSDIPANNVDYSKTLTYTTDGTYIFNGWNLVANPFVCNAYVLNSAGTAYLPYYKMNANGDNFVSVSEGAIAPMEGIFVQATESGQSVKFSRNPLAQSGDRGQLNIMLSNNMTRGNAVVDNAILCFGNESTLEKLSFREGSSKIYITQNYKDYAVKDVESNGEIPVGFMAEKDGSYTISVNTENVNAHYIHLIDNKTGMDTDLLATPSYTFNASTNDYAYRFKLVFNVEIGEANGNDGDNDNFAFMSDGNLVIDNIEGEAVLQIVDVLGRVLSTEIVSGSYNKALNLKAGLYILNLNGMTQKIVVE